MALLDNAPILRTLERLVDFERLNRGETRLTVGCVDVETGREVVRPEHILASTAISPCRPRRG